MSNRGDNRWLFQSQGTDHVNNPGTSRTATALCTDPHEPGRRIYLPGTALKSRPAHRECVITYQTRLLVAASGECRQPCAPRRLGASHPTLEGGGLPRTQT